MKSGSRLEKILASGQFAVTGEAGPPKGASPDVMRKKGELLRAAADALNVTDNQTAVARLSSLAGCLLLKEIGVEPVLQMVVRDRNRLALQGDILGAAALGIRNVLCLSGDHQSLGNHPSARGVYDIDSINLVRLVRTMRDEHRFLNGERMSGEVPMFIGAAGHPFADPFELQLARLAKKVLAGADFIQTQAVFDVPRFLEWMQRVTDRGLHEKTHILAGVLPMKSAKMAAHMRDNVPGVRMPDELVRRMASAADPREEGLAICLETIEQLRSTRSVHGIHVMAVGWEEVVPRLVERAGLVPRPVLS
ncbi:MAG: methylenetetrahydrofolate reductase [Polyangiaceae bacterium]|nr:methylenetetrahydrofolate reductase [Polyangiaceae bacterium]